VFSPLMPENAERTLPAAMMKDSPVGGH